MARLRPSTAGRTSPAVAAEPIGIGPAGAHDPLAVEVRLLGALLGQVTADDIGRARVLRLVQLTVNGVAAGLQSTG